jgi:hypothetical protein
MGSSSCILFPTLFSSSCLFSCTSGMFVAFTRPVFNLFVTIFLWLNVVLSLSLLMGNFLTLSLWLGLALILSACCLLFMLICC